jgi:hypothetical protein
MKKRIAFLALSFAITACISDDQYTWEDNFADRTATDTLSIAILYNGNEVSITGDDKGYVSADGAHVTVRSNTNYFLQISVSGTTENGSLLVYSWKKWGLRLCNANITNPKGPAINNQCNKSFHVMIADGTSNSLTDGTTYSTAPVDANGISIDQKGTLFSEGQIYFQGSGELTVNAHAKNGIASDDYIVMQGGEVNVNVAESGLNGVKVNDGFTISGGKLTIDVKADGAKGIKCDARTLISGGTTTITTAGACKIETSDDGVIDTTSCAGIKSDSLFLMTGGSLTVTSTGDGGKGINCSENIELNGGTLVAITTGGNEVGKPKAVKSSTGIILSGGSFRASCRKSWACDNGSESDEPSERVTVKGSPRTQSYSKKEVIVEF